MTDAQPKTPQVEILEYKPRYAKDFRDINYAWLQEYFEVEPYDQIVLNDPEHHIIKQGGHILLARVKGEIVGACAILKHTERKYELAKMGVVKRFQGLGVGCLLAQAAIDKARTLGADHLVLATSPVLERANHLYHRMGFRDTDLSVLGPLPYKRKSIAMILDL